MPMYVYECTKCHKQEDKIVKLAEVDAGINFDCDCEEGAKLEKTTTPTAAALRFRGRWHTTTGSF